MLAVGPFICLLACSSAHRRAANGQTSHEPPESAPKLSAVAACESRLCRMRAYRTKFRHGEAIALRDEAGRIRSEPECAPLYWHRVVIAGTSGNAFDVATEMLLVGRDASLVAETARLVDGTHTTDGTPAEETRWRRLESGDLAAITLASEMSGMSGYGTMHGASEPTSEPEATQKCQVVHMDSCTGRMGYVCEGFHIRKRFEGYPAPRDEKYVFEIELDPRSATYGLFNGDVLKVR